MLLGLRLILDRRGKSEVDFSCRVGPRRWNKISNYVHPTHRLGRKQSSFTLVCTIYYTALRQLSGGQHVGPVDWLTDGAALVQ